MAPENESDGLIFNYMPLTNRDYFCQAPRHITHPKAAFLCILFDMRTAQEGFRVHQFWGACSDCVQMMMVDINMKGIKPL